MWSSLQTKIMLFLPSYHNNNLKEYITFQHFMLSFFLIQLKAKVTFSQLWWTSYMVLCTKMHTPHREKKMVICFWEIFLVFVFSAWSAVLLCVPSKWQPAFPKYYCVGWHSWDRAELVPWAGWYARHTCHLLAPDKGYECWAQTHGTVAGNPICCAETHLGRR